MHIIRHNFSHNPQLSHKGIQEGTFIMLRNNSMHTCSLTILFHRTVENKNQQMTHILHIQYTVYDS